MTEDEIKAARAVIANVMLQTGPNVFGSATWFRGRATTLAKTLEVALGEIERMTPVYEAAQACPLTSADGWLMCQLKLGHGGNCDMKDVSLAKESR